MLRGSLYNSPTVLLLFIAATATLPARAPRMPALAPTVPIMGAAVAIGNRNDKKHSGF